MTPARFDLMFAIRVEGWWPPSTRLRGQSGPLTRPGLHQKQIVALLGLHPSTVSQMIDRLVALGWMTKKKGSDRRTNFIRLTELGLALIELAMKVVPRRNVHQNWLVGKRGFFRGLKCSRRRAEAVLWEFVWTVRTLADGFGRRRPQLGFDQPVGIYG